MKQFHPRYADKEKLAEKIEAANARDWAALHTRKQRQRRPENHRIDPKGRQLPYIDRLIMSVVSKDVIAAKTGTGEADLQARYLQFSDVPYLKRGEKKNNYKTRLWSLGKGSQVALFPNLNAKDEVWRKVIQDVRFRRALSLGINRKEINEVIYFGLAYPSANTVMPQSALYKDEYSQMWTEHDQAKANALLDEIGLDKRDPDGTRLLPDGRRAEITIETAGESAEETDVLELITDQYREIGLKIFVRSSQRDIFRRRAYAGETLISVFSGLNNAVATPAMNPEELAPTDQAQLQWPMWGQYADTNTKAGESINLDSAMVQMQLFNQWMLASSDEERETIWHNMLSGYADQVFSIGTVNNFKRILYMIPTLVLTSMLVFTLIELPPGDYFESYVNELRAAGETVDPKLIEYLRDEYGFDKPLWERYIQWATGMLVGDFGYSFEYELPVSDVIGDRLGGLWVNFPRIIGLSHSKLPTSFDFDVFSK